jgi:hypothetical protein
MNVEKADAQLKTAAIRWASIERASRTLEGELARLQDRRAELKHEWEVAIDHLRRARPVGRYDTMVSVSPTEAVIIQARYNCDKDDLDISITLGDLL